MRAFLNVLIDKEICMGDYYSNEPILYIDRFLELRKRETTQYNDVIRLRNYRGLSGAFNTHKDLNVVTSSLLYNFSYRDTLTNNGIGVLPRYELENNPDFKQLVVGLIITNKENTQALLLRRKTDDSQNKTLTLIQGHVAIPEFSTDEEIDNYLTSTTLYDVLYDNMIREAEEEVRGLISVVYPSLPSTIHIEYFANNDYDASDISYYHIGFIFELVVDDLSSLTKLESGEPNKHSLEIVNIEDVLNDPLLDNWVYEIFKLNR